MKRLRAGGDGANAGFSGGGGEARGRGRSGTRRPRLCPSIYGPNSAALRLRACWMTSC